MFTIGAEENVGGLLRWPEDVEFRCASSWMGLGGRSFHQEKVFTQRYVSKSCFDKLKIMCLNGPPMGAPEVLVGAFCVKYWCASFWTGPGGQNRKKTHFKNKNTRKAGVGGMGGALKFYSRFPFPC